MPGSPIGSPARRGISDRSSLTPPALDRLIVSADHQTIRRIIDHATPAQLALIVASLSVERLNAVFADVPQQRLLEAVEFLQTHRKVDPETVSNLTSKFVHGRQAARALNRIDRALKSVGVRPVKIDFLQESKVVDSQSTPEPFSFQVVDFLMRSFGRLV